MADPAAQFPVVSSSSFPSSPSSGRSQPGGCHGGSVSCADPPISSSSSSSSSSSQPVSLFAASPAAPAVPARGGSQSPPESPESPFEVVPDRAAFDREFGPALGQIPEGRECHFPPKPRGGLGGPGGLGGSNAPGRGPGGLGRPPPGSAAALEEVSRCVREMHNFTSELLTWDLVERNGPPGDTGDDTGTGNGDLGTGNGDLGAGNGETGTGKGGTGAGSGGVGAGNGDIGTGNGGIGTGKGGARTGNGGGGTGNGVLGTGNGGGGTGNGVLGTGNGGIGTGSGDISVGNGGTGGTGGSDVIGNGAPGVPGVPGIGNGLPAFGGDVPSVTALGVPGVPPVTDGDSSGDSDSTVIEEGPAETPPAPPPPRGATPDVPKDVPKGPDGVPKDVPKDVPKGPARPGVGDWEQEHQTLRALRELGGPPQSPPAGALPRLAVKELLFWRDVRRSAVAFGASLVLLLSLATLSAVTVLAHLALALLSVTISLRVYRAVVQALQKSEEGHPFRAYLDLDVTLSPETFQAVTSAVAQHVNRGLRLLLHLFLVEDLVDSLELALGLWLLTYVGAVFNGITLLILGDLLAFSLPPLYEKYKVQIDHYVDIVRRQTKDVLAKIQAKLPGLAKKKPE